MKFRYVVLFSHRYKYLSRISKIVTGETNGQKGKQSIREKVVDYLDRAEKIKEYLKKTKGSDKKPAKVADTGAAASK